MGSTLRTLFEVLLFAIVVAFVLVMAVGVFWRVFWVTDLTTSQAFIGAFLGAFFAFMFVRLGNWLTAIFERAARARAALVTLQHRLLDLINVIHDEQFIFRKLAEFADHLNDPSAVSLFFNSFASLPQLGSELLLPLLNVDLTNELARLNIEIRKWNNSVATWQRAHDQVRNAFTGGHMNAAAYVVNMREATESGRMLSKFADALKLDASRAFAAVRILSRPDTFLGKVIRFTAHSKFPAHFENMRSEELARIEKEVSERDDSAVANQRRTEAAKAH